MANRSRFFRSFRLPARKAAPLRVSRLEDRTTPSISIPLNAYTWTQIGPTPIGAAADAANQATPGNLTTAGRTFGIASPNPPAGATPAQVAAASQTLLTTTVGGGVFRSTDGGANWGSTTDNLTGLTIFDGGNALAPVQDRSLKMGAIAIAPTAPNIVWAGEGNPGFTDELFVPFGQNHPGYSDRNFAGRGLLKSVDGGLNWQLIKGQNIDGPGAIGRVAFDGMAIVKIVPHPTDPNTCFVVTQGEGDAVYGSFAASAVWRTTDGGQRWVDITTNLPSAAGTAVPVSRTRPITDFTLNPQNPNVAYLSVGDPNLFLPGQAYVNNGVYQTLNALDPITPGPNDTQINSVAFRVSFGGTGGGSGTSPIPGTTLGASRVEVAPSNPAIVYATVAQVNTPAGGQALRMYRTADAGTNWVPVAVPAYIEGATPGLTVGYGGYNQALLVDPGNADRLIIGGRSTSPNNPNALYISVNGGNTWVDISSSGGAADLTGSTPGPQQTIRTLSFDTTGRLLAATDGGVFRFTFAAPGGTTGTWESLNGGPNTGLSNVEVVSVGVPATTVNTYAASTYGNGTVVFRDPGDPVRGPTPATITQADGTVVPNPAYQALFRPPVTDSTPFSGSIQYDATNPNIVYRAESRLNGQGRVTILRSTDGGSTWANTTAQPADPGNSSFDQPAFELDPGDSRRLLVGTDRIQVSENGGNSWGPSLSLLGPNAGGDPYTTPAGIGAVNLGGGNGDLPLVTGRPTNFGNPGVPVTAVGVGRSNFRVVYVAVQNRSRTITGGEQSFGPALYRIDTGNPEDSNGINRTASTAYWRDVSPGRFYWIPGNEMTPPSDPFPGIIDGLPGFPLPGQPYIPMGFQVPAWGMLNGLRGNITDILVDPTNENIVYITVDTDGARGRVYRSVNGGASWTDIGSQLGQVGAATLPAAGNLRPYSVVLDPNLPGTKTDDTVYFATSVGVWGLTDPTANENNDPSNFAYPGKFAGPPTSVLLADVRPTRVGQLAGAPDGTTGLPDVQVTDLRINTTTGLLAAATFGRGVWELQIRPLLSGSLFEDTDGNGVRNNRADGTLEPPQGGVVVEAFDVTNNTQAAVTTTLSNGFYEFRSLPNGTYRVGVVGGVGSGQFVTTGLPPTPNTYTITQNTTIPGNTGPGGVPQLTPAADIGAFKLADIRGTVFDDLDGNGLRGPTEPPLAGRVVRLFTRDRNGVLSPAVNPATGLAVPVATTDAAGLYTFARLAPSEDKSQFSATTGFFVQPYVVRADVPAGTVQSSAPVADTRLLSGTDKTAGTDVGSFTLVTIQGVVFDDSNGDGVRQGEPRLGGVTVRLLQVQPDGSKLAVASQVSAADGAYSFPNRGPGTYYVQEDVATLPPGGNGQVVYRVTTANPLGPIVPQSGQGLASPPRSPGVPAQLGPFDLGNFRNAGLRGVVFEDLNGDGRLQLNEDPTRPEADPRANFIVGATVQLLDPGADNDSRTEADNVVLATAVTDSGGNYLFSDRQPLVAGNGRAYFTRVVAPADLFVQTSADARAQLVSGIVTGGLNLGYFRRTTVSGFAFEDTNGNGLQDAGEPAATNFPVSLLNATDPTQVVAVATTDATGQYRFTGLGPLQVNAAAGPGGAVIAYRVAANLANVVQTNAPGDLVLTSGVPAQGPTLALFRTVGFGGVVYDDSNGNGTRDGEPGVAGVLVQLVTANGSPAVNPATGQPIQALTDAGGGYTLQAPNGTFTVRLGNLPAGTIQTTAEPAAVTTTSGRVLPPIDLGVFRTFAVAGVVYDDLNGNGGRDAGEPGLANVSVRLTTAGGLPTAFTAVTTGDGSYTIPGVGPGSYLLTPVLPPGSYYTSPAGPVAVTASSGLVVPAANTPTSFGVYRGATVSGSVFEDLNRSGTLDGGEPGSGGWTVQVVDGAGRPLAAGPVDANGNYSIGAIPPGAVSVQLAARAGWLTTASPLPLGSVLTSGGALAARPLGGLRLGSVEGRVFSDSNRNGRLDGAETGLAGVGVELLQNGAVVATRTTTGDGFYQFLTLPAGGYTVRVNAGTLATGRVQTGPQSSGLVYPLGVTEGSTTAGNLTTGRDFGVAGRKRYAVAADGGGGPRVQVYDAVTGVKVSDQFVYEQSFTGGVRVASADVNGDGVDDLITVPGVGGGPRVRAIDGVTGATIYDYFAYEPTFRLGLFVAAADVNGDGFADIITGTDAGGGPRVTVFSGRDGSQLLDFFAFDSEFRGGVRIGAADVDGDGKAEVIAASGVGVAAEVRVFDSTGRRVQTFSPVDAGYTGGLFVAGAATDPFTGRAGVLVGTGRGFADQGYAFVFDGQTGQQQYQVEAFPQGPDDAQTYQGDVRVASFDTTGDSVPEIVIASGAGTRSMVRFLDGNNRREIATLMPFEAAFLGGLFVG